MNYPYQCPRTYENPQGNLAASGYYRSSMTQELVNMMPSWMHLRSNPRSMGQQFISPMALELKSLENKLNDCMRNKFITTARIDEPDVLYRIKIPNNIDLTDASASGVRCVTAPSGCSPSGVSQIWVKEVNKLEEFYYHVIPTRIEVFSSGDYISSVDSVSWHTQPSGIIDSEEKHVDVWGTKHDITWCYNNDSPTGRVRKQDSETLEDYEVYNQPPAAGLVTDMDFYRGMLWCLSTNGSSYYITLLSTKTQLPQNTTLDIMAIYNLTTGFDLQPSGILVDDAGVIKVRDTNRTRTYTLYPRYDYFIMDKDNRYIYFKEDYRYPGVFVSNT